MNIYDRKFEDKRLEDWERAAYLSFDEKMSSKINKFPCIPAIKGYSLDHFRFAFGNDPRYPEAVSELASFLKKYDECASNLGDYSALIVFFHTPEELRNNYSVHEFETLFWKLLNGVCELDKQKWPKEISTDPNHYTWEFCFNGESYFVYCATPAHQDRLSRYFPFFMLAFTPRWVLTKFNAQSEKAEKMKAAIRERIYEYDKLPPHPELKWYGQTDNYEWKQYFLRDDEGIALTCPFKHKKT